MTSNRVGVIGISLFLRKFRLTLKHDLSSDGFGPVIRFTRPADDWASATPDNQIIRIELSEAMMKRLAQGIPWAEIELRISREDAEVLAKSPEIVDYIRWNEGIYGFKAELLPDIIYGLKVVIL